MTQTVLVADDSLASQRLFEMVLTREGFEVVTVGSGPDVVNRVKEKHPDLALIDAVMPGVDGLQICQALKTDPELKNLPIIMLAGTYEDVDRQRGASIVGDQAILEKPATSQVILAKVNELLQAQQPAAAPVPADVVPEPSFVEEEYEFEEDAEEVDLAVESELLEEEAEWEEPDDELIEEVVEEVEFDEIEAVEEIDASASAEPATAPISAAAPAPAAALSDEQLDAVAADIAARVAAKLGPAVLQAAAEHLLQLPAVRQIVDDASKRLVSDILPDIRKSLQE